MSKPLSDQLVGVAHLLIIYSPLLLLLSVGVQEELRLSGDPEAGMLWSVTFERLEEARGMGCRRCGGVAGGERFCRACKRALKREGVKKDEIIFAFWIAFLWICLLAGLAISFC